MFWIFLINLFIRSIFFCSLQNKYCEFSLISIVLILCFLINSQSMVWNYLKRLLNRNLIQLLEKNCPITEAISSAIVMKILYIQVGLLEDWQCNSNFGRFRLFFVANQLSPCGFFSSNNRWQLDSFHHVSHYSLTDILLDKFGRVLLI